MVVVIVIGFFGSRAAGLIPDRSVKEFAVVTTFSFTMYLAWLSLLLFRNIVARRRGILLPVFFMRNPYSIFLRTDQARSQTYGLVMEKNFKGWLLYEVCCFLPAGIVWVFLSGWLWGMIERTYFR